MEYKQRKRGNYLSIDGGPSGLPALYILEELFYRLQSDLESGDELIPCRWFDTIIGTGRGATVALLIGKLELTASKAIEAYTKLASSLSIKPAKNDDEKKINTESFKTAFSKVLSEAGFTIDAPMLDESSTKTIVCVANATNISVMNPIRSYRIRGAPPPPCTIMEAACACIASPDTFLPATIGTGHRKIALVNAVAGYANPTKELLKEAQKVLGDEAEVASIISIGAGKWNIQVTPELRSGLDVSEALKRGILSGEQVHQDLHGRLLEAAIYFRFNMEVDTENDPENMPTHLAAYLGEAATSSQLDEAIRRIRDQPSGIKLKEINSVTAVEIKLKPRPRLVQNFVGRQDILEAMRQTHFINSSAQPASPCMSVLSGLGGSGKTQTALKFAFEFEEIYPDVAVFFLDASAPDKLKTDLETVIRSQGPSYHSKSYKDALEWLAAGATNWLAILDNADDPTFNLNEYIPKGGHGHVIITTRNATYASLAPNSSHALEGLSTSDSITLVLSAAKYPDTEDNRSLAEKIVLELGGLPLALAHAAGYIFVHRCLGTYLDIYRENRKKILASSNSGLLHDYHSSVAMTIQMSLERLPQEAHHMMRLFSHLQATSIPYSIIVKAAERRFQRVEKTKKISLNPQTLQQADVLMKVLCPSGKWSEYEFNELLFQCLQYSLLQLTMQGEDKFYSMHVLVQLYLRDETRLIHGQSSQRLIIRLLGSSITHSFDYEYLAFNRLLLPHLRLIQIEQVIEGGDLYGFGHVLDETGDSRLALFHQEKCVEMWRESLGESHELTLRAMRGLSWSYGDMKMLNESLQLREKILEIRQRSGNPEHESTLSAMAEVAIAYVDVGKTQEALEIQETVLEMRKRLFGPEDLDTIKVRGSLANSYSLLGRHQEALMLDQEVVEMRMKVLGPKHPATMRSMVRLADSYYMAGNNEKALELEEQVLETQHILFGPEHQDTLHTMKNLAIFYKDSGRPLDAAKLEEKVLEMRKKLLGPEHPDTIQTKDDLASSYSRMGRKQEALRLYQEVLEMREWVFGPEHSLTQESREVVTNFQSWDQVPQS